MVSFKVANDFTGGTVAVAAEVNANFNAIGSEINSQSIGSLTLTHIVPVGTILPWDRDKTGVPALPNGWQECDGSSIDDPKSPLSGTIAITPNLNGEARYLAGSTTTGIFTGSLTHTHHLLGGGGTNRLSTSISDEFVQLDNLGTSASYVNQLSKTESNSVPTYSIAFIMRIY